MPPGAQRLASDKGFNPRRTGGLCLCYSASEKWRAPPASALSSAQLNTATSTCAIPSKKSRNFKASYKKQLAMFTWVLVGFTPGTGARFLKQCEPLLERNDPEIELSPRKGFPRLEGPCDLQEAWTLPRQCLGVYSSAERGNPARKVV